MTSVVGNLGTWSVTAGTVLERKRGN